ncbi:MAG: MaoC family dehydratase [Candidatus Helarchaeota archaeon]
MNRGNNELNNNIKKNEIKVGDEIPPYKVRIDAKVYKKYNRLINEINPLHFNRNYAQKLGFRDIVVAGNFTFMFIPKWLLEWAGDIKSLKKVSVKFNNPVYLGDELIHTGKITSVEVEGNKKIVDGKYSVNKTSGELVSEGEFTFNFNLAPI